MTSQVVSNRSRQTGSTIVMKFGGTSIGSADAMAQTVAIVQEQHDREQCLIVVTSALAGITNLLLEGAQLASTGDLDSLSQFTRHLHDAHQEIVTALVNTPTPNNEIELQLEVLTAEFASLYKAIGVLGEATPRALDAVASLGERMSVRLLEAALRSCNVPAQHLDATGLITTDGCFQSAHPDMAATSQKVRQVLLPLLEAGIIPVVTGFIGATPEGITTTLGRGGSDYSAALIGAALPASEVWIWTDVDGVMSADPRWVPEAHTLPELSYREIAELAYYGAKVVHPKTIRPIIESGIGLRICNTFNPREPGTRLVQDSKSRQNGQIKAVTAIREQELVTIEGRGMLGVPGVAARAFGAVASTNTSVPLITQASSEQSICFAVPGERTQEVLTALKDAFASELASRDIDRIWATGETVIVTVVGAGMQQTPGIAGRVFSALGNHGVNVIAIAQGSSEVSISLVVDAGDAEKAVRCLHELTTS